MAATKPAKYPKAKPPSSIIDDWLDNHPEGALQRQYLFSYAQLNVRNPGVVIAHLIQEGLPVSPLQLKAWMTKYGIKPGTMAEQVNAGAAEFAGVDVIALLERQTVQLAQMSGQYMDLVQQAFADKKVSIHAWQQCMTQLPTITNQARMTAMALSSVKTKKEETNLIMSGAQRVATILRANLKTHPEGKWISTELDAILIQIAEEIGAVDTEV